MARSYGQYCGVSTALELVGERWALLIVRDLLVGTRRYTDLKAGLPKVPTNVLSTRLKELQEAGVIRRALAPGGTVYELTEFGRGLEEVVLALGRWGFQAMGDPAEGDVVTTDSLTMAFRTAFRPEVARALPATAYEVHVGDVALRVEVTPDGLHIRPVGTLRPVDRIGVPVVGDPDLTIATGPGLRGVISGEVSPGEALASGIVHVLAGDAALLARFAATFHLEPMAVPPTAA